MEEKSNISKNTRPGLFPVIILIISAILAVAAAGSSAVLYLNRWQTDIVLKGDGSCTVEYGETFEDPGAEAHVSGTIIHFFDRDVPVAVSGQVDTGKTGKYFLTYTARETILSERTSAVSVRTVDVTDTVPPVITLEYKEDYYTVPGHEYADEGYSASDNADGDITDRVERKEENGTVYYSVSDSSGNTAQAQRTIVYDDRIPPVITLTGESEITLFERDGWKDPGAVASDDVDGDITDRIETEGGADTSVPGKYVIKYTVKDSYDNSASAERTVTVKPRRVPVQAETPYGGKVIYLTFDDGPGPYTERLLDILKRHNVRATFFVTAQFPAYLDLITREYDEGHTVAVHTYSHVFPEIYSSPEAYWNDFDRINEVIYQKTGTRSVMFRFPGGSSNGVSARYCTGIMSTLVSQAAEKGLSYFDWNVSSGDAGGTTVSSVVLSNLKAGVSGRTTAVVLCHDIKSYTVDAMEDFITWALMNGYEFRALSPSDYGAHHRVWN